MGIDRELSRIRDFYLCLKLPCQIKSAAGHYLTESRKTSVDFVWPRCQMMLFKPRGDSSTDNLGNLLLGVWRQLDHGAARSEGLV